MNAFNFIVSLFLPGISSTMDILAESWSAAKEHWIILTLLFLAILIYWHYVINFTVLKDLGFRGPTPLPLIGNLLGLVLHGKSFHELQIQHQKSYGRVFGYYLLKTPSVVVSDPEILKVILVKEFDKFHDRPVCSIFNILYEVYFTI